MCIFFGAGGVYRDVTRRSGREGNCDKRGKRNVVSSSNRGQKTNYLQRKHRGGYPNGRFLFCVTAANWGRKQSRGTFRES
jgi:hypothetical protein